MMVKFQNDNQPGIKWIYLISFTVLKSTELSNKKSESDFFFFFNFQSLVIGVC